MDAAFLDECSLAAKTRRLGDFMEGYDKVKLKRITVEQAARALEICGVAVSKAHREELRSHYTGPDGQFEYARFMNDVNDVRPNGFFETHLEVDPATATSAGRLGSPEPVPVDAPRLELLTDAQQRHLKEVLRHARDISKQRGLLLARYVRQYDRTGRGLVTANQFVRAFLEAFQGIGPADAEVLAKAYGTPDGQVYYRAVHDAITPDDEEVSLTSRGFLGRTMRDKTHKEDPHARRSPSPNSRLAASMRTGVAHDSVDAAEARLIRQVFERRIRVREFLAPFDKLRHGTITRAQFIRALSQCKLEGISALEYEALATRYADPADITGQNVLYAWFSDTVERAFAEIGLEKDPEKREDSFAKTIATSAPPRTMRPELTEAQASSLRSGLSGIKSNVQRWRMYNFDAGLKDFDHAHEGYITQEQFLRVLASYGLVPEKPEDRSVLLHFYAGPGTRSHMVDYRAFVVDVNAA